MTDLVEAVIRPHDESEVEEAVRQAVADSQPLEIVGGGTKRGLGRPTQTAASLATGGLSGITLYEPSELVIAARAGTPLAEIEAALSEKGQRLPFEPVTLRSLYATGGEPTIGAVAACNLSGPRRIHSGAARDGLIGIRAVTGRGETIKSGGRVMKNVTGYDLVKLMAGSFGTLGIMTEVTFKVLPTPETEATLAFSGLDEQTAVACMAAGLGSPWEVTGAAHLPRDDEPGMTLLRMEGFASQVAYRADALAGALAQYGLPEIVRGPESGRLWREVAELAPLAGNGESEVWKVSTTPTRAPEIAEAVGAVADIRHFYDWGGGLIWIAVRSAENGSAAIIRNALLATGGHATLMRGADELRTRTEIFHPEPAPTMELTRRLKESFDPHRVLNPGRMYAGI